MSRRVFAAVAFGVALLIGCSGDPEPGAADDVAANPAAATGLRLNEVRILPASEAPLFVEIDNSGAAAVALDGALLQVDGGATIALPGGVAVAPSSALALLFDDGQGVDANGVHLPAGDFTGGEAGRIELQLPTGVADAIAWGRPELAAVSLCRGGRCGAPKAGSVVARVPNETAPLDATVWALLDPELATPGAANPRPPVSELAALPGFIFTDAPHFSWYSVPGAAHYRLEVGRGETFADLVHEVEVEATQGVRLEQLTADGPELPPGEYVWRVRALAASGEAAEPSVAMPFSVDPSRAVVAPVDTRTAPAGEGRPPGRLKVLDVPIIKHAKDTRMLTLEAANEDVWDTPNLGGYPYCARAGVAMVNAYYQNKLPPDQRRILSQDRIGYEVFSNLDGSPPGAEYDLPVVGIDDSDTDKYSLPLALGATGDYVVNRDYADGRHRDACYDYVTSLALAQCAGQCADARTPECFACRLAREREIPCPDEIGHRWGVLAIEDIQREIDAERPIIATKSGHLFLIVGYRLEEGRFYFFYQDAGGRQEVQANAGGLMGIIMSYWVGLAAVAVGNDEPSVGTDSDNDGVVDFDELKRFGTKESAPDSDGDEVPDKVEIRASVWDPQHGYHRGVATLEPTAATSVVKERASSADLSGRDFDRDGVAMELDRDSDGGGCRDGVEDASFDGVRDGRESYNFDPDDDDCGAPPLGGVVKMAYDYASVRRAICVGRVEIEARFALQPVINPDVPEIVHTYRADEITYDIRTDGCPDYPGDDLVYTFSQGLHLSGTIALTEQSLGYVTFFPAYPQFSLQLPVDITYFNGINELPGSYTMADGTVFPAETSVVFEALTIESNPANCGNASDPMRARPDQLDFCTEPTPCGTQQNVPMQCYTEPQRYYVLPFRKSFQWDAANEPGEEYHIADVNVTVDICEGCGP